MAEIEEPGGEGSINPIENLPRWLDQKTEAIRADAPSATPAEPVAQPVGQPGPAAEPPAAPAPAPQTPEPPKSGGWRDVVFDDVDHGFLKGRTGKDVIESYRHAESAKQQAEARANAAERRALELEQQLVQSRPQSGSTPDRSVVPPNPENDPEIEKIRELWYDDPAQAMQLMEARTRRIWHEEHERQTSADGWQRLTEASGTASITAAQRAMQMYGWDEAQAVARLESTFPHLQKYERQHGPVVWAHPENYLAMLEYLYGPPQAAAPPAADVTPDPEPEIANPPDARKPTPIVPRAAQPSTSVLSREKEASVRRLMDSLKLDSTRTVNRLRRPA